MAVKTAKLTGAEAAVTGLDGSIAHIRNDGAGVVWVLKTHYTHYTRLMSICQYCLPEKAAGTVKLRFLSPKGV